MSGPILDYHRTIVAPAFESMTKTAAQLVDISAKLTEAFEELTARVAELELDKAVAEEALHD